MSGERPLSAAARKRWRVVTGLAAALGLGVLIWIWFVYDGQRQDRYLRTAGLLFGAFCFFLIWVLFGSGWTRPRRLTVFAVVLAGLAFSATCLKITGVNGDLMPIVGWRWSQKTSPSRNVAVTSPASEPSGLTNRYPQFLGPSRNGVLAEPHLERDWVRQPPVELWRRAVGPAWSGFAIERHHAVTQEQDGGKELVVCYDLASGEPHWSHSDASRYATTVAGEGPRATPTIVGNRVYSMGGAGILNCLDLETGRVIWSTNTLAQHGLSEPPMWGVACSPLVTEKAVIVTVGGAGHTLVAYDRESGKILWSAGSDEVQWSSPVRAVLDGVPQILIFNLGLAAHDEATGKVLWQYPWPGQNPRVTLPLVLEKDRVLISTGYGIGSELLQVSREKERWKAKRLWKSIRMKSKFANLFLIDGFVYGLDDGALACIDVSNGELKWKGDRYGHGQMILVGGLILIMAERGELVLVEPHPSEPRELGRFKVFDAKTWNPPALAGDRLVVRNDREAASFRLPVLRSSQ